MAGADVGGLLRSAVASMCLTAGVLHISAAADHRGMTGHVVFFVAVAMAQSALAAALFWTGRPGRWLAVATAGNLAVAFIWVLSRTSGLPVDATSAPEAIGFKDGIATMLEFGVAAGAGMWCLLPETGRHVVVPSWRLASTMLGTGVWAIGAAGLFAGHTHSAGHSHAGAHAHGAQQASAAQEAHGLDHDHVAVTEPTHDPSDHHHEPESRFVAASTPAFDAQGHGHAHHDATEPAPRQASSHHHDGLATGATAVAAQDDPGHAADHHGQPHDAASGGDHQHESGDGHNHDHEHDQDHDNGSSGNDGGDEDGGASPLDDLLKLIRPR